MGSSGKWLKSLITLKKLPSTDQEKVKQSVNKGKKKWRLWRSSSEGFGSSSSKGLKRVHVSSSELSDSSIVLDDAFAAAMATVVRAPPRDFMVVKQAWAAIRIQTALRSLLARLALRALKAVVRIQALFRGRQVRQQAVVTLRCMQALARVQARVRGVRMSSEGQSAVELLDDHHIADPAKQAEQGWCNSRGTVDEVRAKLQMRQEGAVKRERAIAYSLCQQQSRSCDSPAKRTNKSPSSLKNQRMDNSSPGWSWMDRWMATKPWENRLMEESHTDSSDTPFSRRSDDNIASIYSHSSTHDSVIVRRNNVTTKILAKRPMVSHTTRSSSSPSSESIYNERSESTSSPAVSPILLTSNVIVVDKIEESYNRKSSYMNLTESIKAKQKASRLPAYKMQRHIMEDEFHTMSMPLSFGDAKSTAWSNPSFGLCRDLYPPIPLGRHDEFGN